MGFDRINRPALNKPNGSRAVMQGDRITECKLCTEGIYASEPRIWASRVMPSRASGLVHCRCAEAHPDTVTAGPATVGGQRKYRT